jgi:hypothetical protein
MAKLVPAGVTLRDQINERWKGRDKASDGWVGDAAHASRPSDHNPDAQGWVHAIDIDADLRGSQYDIDWFAEQLIAYARVRRQGSKRLKNIVWDDQVASGTYEGTFWVFRGSGYGHTQHVHVSFTDQAETNGNQFDLPIFTGKNNIWDGVVPFFDVLDKASNTAQKNKATHRLACRLKELGFYQGVVLPEGQQGFPTTAVTYMQDWMGWEVRPYSAKTHKAIWRELRISGD